MEEKKDSNAKFLWYVLFAVVTVILCYLFAVVYFYFISPNNISLKLGLWPFVPNQTIGEMYLDATVEINFKVDDETTFEEIEKSVVGVNIREDGYIVSACNEFRDLKEANGIRILTNSGKVFNGKILYEDMNYNLVVLKCENIDEKQDKIKIPFVNISSVSNGLNADTKIIAVSSPLRNKNIWSGTVVDSSMTNVYKQMTIENNLAVDFVIEQCYEISLDVNEASYTGGAIFNKSGGLLGLSFESTLDNGNYIIMPVDATKLFLDKIVENYEKEIVYANPLVESLIGFDQIELMCFMDASIRNTGNEGNFYFRNNWQVYTDNIVFYSNSDVSGYYLFEDFVYNGETVLNSSNVIASLRYNQKTYVIDTKIDLLNLFYKMNSGESVTIYYYLIDDLGSVAKSTVLTK